MKITCKHCDDMFTLDKDTVTLIEDGFVNIYDVDICDECSSLTNMPPDYPEISDADSGL